VATKLWRWGVTRADDPANMLQWQSGSHDLMALPPGEYQVQSSSLGSENEWMVWPQKIQIQPDQQVALRIDSSARLDMPQNLGNFWRWQLARFGRSDQVVQSQSGDQRNMIVPPGEYQITSSAFGSENQWIVWPQKVQVQSGHQSTLLWTVAFDSPGQDRRRIPSFR
jgi:hypothetical protein